MTRMFKNDGTVVPATVVTAGPCTVVQVKTKEKDGVDAVQIGFGSTRKLNKAAAGHRKDLPKLRTLGEFRVSDPGAFSRGMTLDVTQFAAGDAIKVIGTSKGRGFAGVVKRHGFHGHNATHGTKDQLRTSGSIGAGGVQHVFKGTRMGGRLGAERVTVRNLTVVGIDAEKHELMISGAIPGSRNSIVRIIADA